MKRIHLLLMLPALLALPAPGLALEKTAVRMTDEDLAGWTADYTCSVVYYNMCNGWVWLWGGWMPGDVVGTCYDTCSGEVTLLDRSITYFRNVAPSGYGFTGAIAVQGADADCCPTGVLASAPLLPLLRWNVNFWGIRVPPRFVVTFEFGPGTGTPLRPGTDHPAAGPTGPMDCGKCYPDRSAHSFYWGTASTPLCPGSTFFDGVCNAELVGRAHILLPVAVDGASWGSVKALYR